MLLYAQTPSLQFTSTVSKSTYKHYKPIVWIVKKKPKELAISQKCFGHMTYGTCMYPGSYKSLHDKFILSLLGKEAKSRSWKTRIRWDRETKTGGCCLEEPETSKPSYDFHWIYINWCEGILMNINFFSLNSCSQLLHTVLLQVCHHTLGMSYPCYRIFTYILN